MELKLSVDRQTNNEQALTNGVYINQDDYELLIPISKRKENNFVLMKGFVFTIR